MKISPFAFTVRVAEEPLNNNRDPHDPRMKLGMYEKLVAAGVKPVVDVRVLQGACADKVLERLGFVEEPRGESGRSFKLGSPGIYRNGQRARINDDGSVALISFAGSFVEVIKIRTDGVVEHSVERLP